MQACNEKEYKHRGVGNNFGFIEKPYNILGFRKGQKQPSEKKKPQKQTVFSFKGHFDQGNQFTKGLKQGFL